MKKTVILILLIAPLILIYIISFAGRVLGEYTYIYVERVVFLNDENDEYDEGEIIELNVGDQKQLGVKIYPELAYNKHYKFIYDKDEGVFEINKDGLLTAIKPGIIRLAVQTTERSLKSELRVRVLGKEIESISLNTNNLNLGVGSKHTLLVTFNPVNASGSKNISFTSNNTAVAEVNRNGEITAKSEGVATITATTANGKTASVLVTVENQKLDGVYFINEGSSDVIVTTNNLFNLHDITEINLKDVDYSQLKYSIISGSLNTDILLEEINGEIYVNFNDNKNKIVKIKVEVIETSYYDEISIVLT